MVKWSPEVRMIYMCFNYSTNICNIIFNTKVSMNNLTMSSYNDKISEIRARVMSRQKDKDYGREGVYKYANENATHHPSKY